MARLYALLISLTLVTFALAQDTTEPAADETAAAAESATTADDEAEGSTEPDLDDNLELDEQTYEEDDDVFVPTEEIPSDEPIPFPTNI